VLLPKPHADQRRPGKKERWGPRKKQIDWWWKKEKGTLFSTEGTFLLKIGTNDRRRGVSETLVGRS